ncbi:MAG: DMT family transporter [Cyclobacteriaceae bacterium]
MTDRNKGILFAATTAMIWGLLVIAIKVSLNYLDPISITWMRFLFAFGALAVFFMLREPKQLSMIKGPPKWALIAGVALGINYVCYISGLQYTSPSNAQVIIQIAPLLLVVVGLVIYREKVSFWQRLGLITAVVGFALFYRDQISQLIGKESTYNQGVLWVVVAALAWVVFASLQKKMVQKHSAQGLNMIIFLVPAVLLIPWVSWTGIASMNWQGWLMILYLSVNTLLAYGLLAESFRYIPANTVGIIVTVNPIITMLAMAALAYLEVSWIGMESISLLGVLGACLVVTGAILASLSPKVLGKMKQARLKSA